MPSSLYALLTLWIPTTRLPQPTSAPPEISAISNNESIGASNQVSGILADKITKIEIQLSAIASKVTTIMQGQLEKKPIIRKVAKGAGNESKKCAKSKVNQPIGEVKEPQANKKRNKASETLPACKRPRQKYCRHQAAEIRQSVNVRAFSATETSIERKSRILLSRELELLLLSE